MVDPQHPRSPVLSFSLHSHSSLLLCELLESLESSVNFPPSRGKQLSDLPFSLHPSSLAISFAPSFYHVRSPASSSLSVPEGESPENNSVVIRPLESHATFSTSSLSYAGSVFLRSTFRTRERKRLGPLNIRFLSPDLFLL